MSNRKRELMAVSLFAGGGGLTLGTARAGFKTLFATDIEPSAADTFKRNFSGVPFFHGDIRHLTKHDIQAATRGQHVDLVVGGPPCQGFSTMGDQNPADARNGLFESFARVIAWLKPSCFLLENVNYLRTQYGGRYEKEITAALEALGYRVSVTTLNAADYGVPQIRKRVFFFGTAFPADFAWPVPTHGPGRQPYTTVRAAIADLTIGNGDAPNHVHLKHSMKVVARYRLIPEGGRMPPPALLPAEIRRKNFGNTYKRLHRDRPSLTLVPGNNAFPVHPTEDRSLSPREAARLQTFPDDFIFSGSRAEQCRLVGNAVPVQLAEKICEAIREYLSAMKDHAEGSAVSSLLKQPAVVVRQRPPVKTALVTGVSLFTGIGGLLLGFQNAGVDVLASYDLKKSVAANCAVNFPDLNHFMLDVGRLTAKEIIANTGGGPIDVVFGGPPCQGFSIFGRRRFINTQDHRPESDERNELSIKYIDLAIELDPRVIFLENVKGFVSTPRGSTTYLAEIERRLHEAGYEVSWKIVNCADFGIPQSRERFILVAWSAGLKFVWPEAKHFADPKPWQRGFATVGDVISDLMDPASYSAEFSHLPMKHKELVVERYKLIPEGGRLPESTMPDALRKGYRSDNVKNYSHVYRRLGMSVPATTMVPGHNAFPVHPLLHRTLTAREAARIQTFPDWIQFQGTRQQQCTLVGNAVPPLLSELFASNIVKTLNGNYLSKGYKRDVYDLATAS